MTKEITDRKKESYTERDNASRMEQERASELHEMHKRNIMNMSHQTTLDIPDSYVPAGMVYRWVCDSVRGEPNHATMIEARSKGWTPVPATRHPDMCFADYMGRDSHTKSYIWRNGALLCERSVELNNLEREQLAKIHYQQMTSLQGIENFMSDASSYVRDNSKTSIRSVVSGF